MQATCPTPPTRIAPRVRGARTCTRSGAGRWSAFIALLSIALLAGCAHGPGRSSAPPDWGPSVVPTPGRDGAEARPPTDLARVPDAEPRLETIRPGGANKPYAELGKTYVPITQDTPYTERGLASWYGTAFHGRRTASGEVYNMYGMTAAHKTLPIPSYARVRNPANGREIVVRINDRGPFHAGRILDLSYTAALKLDLLRGVGTIELQRITSDEIRTGAWRRDSDATRLADGSTPSGAAGTVGAAAAIPAPAVVAAQVATASPIPTSTATATLTVTPASTSTPAQASSSSTPAPSPVAAPLVPGVLAVAASPLDVAAATTNDAVTTPLPPASSPASTEPGAAVQDGPIARAYTTTARGFWVQLGAFRARDGAELFQRRVVADLEWLRPLLAVFSDASLFRLQAGPYPSRVEAKRVAERVRDDLKLVPVIVERR